MDSEENIIISLSPETGEIKPTRINRNIYSIMLFIIPAIYSYYALPDLKCTIACLLCLITGFIHHYHRAKNKILRVIDITTVFLIIGYYTYLCISNAGLKFYTIIMYFFLGLTIAFYVFLLKKPHLYDDYHFILHILAITGVMFCIKSLKEYCYVSECYSDPAPSTIECDELTTL
jgi:hypothetical protein